MKKKANNGLQCLFPKKLACVLIAMLTVLLLSGCGKKAVADIAVIKNVVSRNLIETPTSENESLSYTDSEKSFTDAVASSGLIELLADRKMCSFAIRETSKNVLWSALPLKSDLTENDTLQNEACIARLKVTGGTDEYILDTQNNSLKFGTCECNKIKDGIRLEFDIFPDEKTAKKAAYAKSDIGFHLTVSVTLSSGSAFVECAYSNITGNPNAYIESITLLNYFGAYNDMSKGDWIFVPDGCGAVIDTSIYDEGFEKVSLSVYGSQKNETSSQTALIPVYGIKHGSSAFAAIIEKGDAASHIYAEKARTISEYNRVYPSFEITPDLYDGKNISVSKKVQTNEIRLCLRFLSGKNATYAGMACACREQLIRNNVLPSDPIEDDDGYLPFFLTLDGARMKELTPVKYHKSSTTFDQAQDMLIRIKSKGINNVFLRYCNIFKDEDDVDDAENSSILFAVGSRRGLKRLYNYTASQRMKLFINTDIFKTAKNNKYPCAVDITGEMLKSPGYYLKTLSSLNSSTLAILSKFDNIGFDGFCFDDFGSFIYDDFSTSGVLRSVAISNAVKSVATLSTGRTTMINGGNIYAARYARAIVNMPLTASCDESGACTSVPFLQIVLHALADYSSQSVNTSADSRETLLKCIEYGACPHCAWTYASDGTPEGEKMYYDNSINNIASFYIK
ncbi:MAG: hypothetical protein K6B52_06540, partial [Clostridiales bacterium]|nr:hypothetical protein [Clostridiales bacterium]